MAFHHEDARLEHMADALTHVRKTFAPFFAKQADGSLGHVKKIGDKIVALGGVPTVEPSRVQQATTLQEMLKKSVSKRKAAQKEVA